MLVLMKEIEKLWVIWFWIDQIIWNWFWPGTGSWLPSRGHPALKILANKNQLLCINTWCVSVCNSCRLCPCPASQQISVMSPGDIVKVRLQCQTESKRGGTNTPKPKYRGPVHCLLKIVKEEGFLGLYRGALPLMLRDGPSYATYFLTYTTICEWLTDGSNKRPGEQSCDLFLLSRLCVLC